ncbi:MAG: polysaccharide export protein, partial [Moraxellaceae bacterium]
SISVEVLGEHDSAREMILPVGASLKDVLESINFTRRSNQSGIQLYRASVAAEQKEMLAASLSLLERNVLTTPSSTNEAALLRKVEAEGVLSWISRARQVEPRGQIILTEGFDPSAVLLRQGDRIVIPSVNSIVQVHGDVTFPAAIVFKHKQSVMSYLNQAGGVSGRIKNKMIFIKKPNGSFLSLKGSVKYRGAVEPGDEIFVLSKPEVKSLQLTKDISQVLYQIAIAAAVVVAF